jgi:hypothetical protein
MDGPRRHAQCDADIRDIAGARQVADLEENAGAMINGILKNDKSPMCDTPNVRENAANALRGPRPKNEQ